MTLSGLSVRRPVFATVISLTLVLVGLAALRTLPVREYPAIAAPWITVATSYRGAAAAVVETQVTRRIEEQLAGLEGVTRLTSYSQDGQSRVLLEFGLGRDLEQAANDVRNRVSRVAGSLPGAAGDPRVIKAGSGVTACSRSPTSSSASSSIRSPPWTAWRACASPAPRARVCASRSTRGPWRRGA